jgi:mycothiol synthase
VNVLVLSELDAAQLSALSALLARCEQVDGHRALAEPQRAMAVRADLGGEGGRAELLYDGKELVGCAILSPATDGATAVHVAIDPAHRASGNEPAGTDARTVLIETALQNAPGTLRLWTMQATEADDVAAASLGFQPERDVLQMRVPLPLPPETVAAARPLTTRPFVPGQDDEEWLSINNRAFAGHPEQGGWTMSQLHERMKAPWFSPEGFLVADAPDGGGLIGSCWTKVHRHSDPMLGEIYVIAVDPDRHGQGWGRALTVAGLRWLAAQGVPVGMLYTSASNTAAVDLYRSLGFANDHLDRSYLNRPPGHGA